MGSHDRVARAWSGGATYRGGFDDDGTTEMDTANLVALRAQRVRGLMGELDVEPVC